MDEIENVKKGPLKLKGLKSKKATRKTVKVTTNLKTKAELKFIETQKQRQQEKIKKEGKKSHKDKVAVNKIII